MVEGCIDGSAGRIGKSDVAVRVMLSRTVQKLQQRLGK
jgi:hypothetical protein